MVLGFFMRFCKTYKLTDILTLIIFKKAFNNTFLHTKNKAFLFDLLKNSF
jgi:hypothetical protein